MSSLKYIHFNKSPQNTIAIGFILLVFSLVFSKANAQDKQVVQVKAFTEDLSPYPDLSISINKRAFVDLNNKGVVFVNLSSSDIPIQSIKLKDQALEVASWNLSKGILEVIVRKKSYIDKEILVIDQNGDPVSGVEVQFSGSKNLIKTTGSNGIISIPLALNEEIKGGNQFEIKGYEIRNFKKGATNRLHVTKIVRSVERVEPKTIEKSFDLPDKNTANDLSPQQIDTISSLRIFYDLVNQVGREDIDQATQLKLDAKFEELLENISGGNKSDDDNLLSQISDSTVVEEDIDKLLEQAKIDNANMHEQRVLKEKIQLVRDKLNVGFENMTKESKENLLVEIKELENILKSNKSQFNQNLNTYLTVINELKRRFFDLQELESRLSESESERLKEKRIYQQRLLLTLAVLLIFAFLIILLFYFRTRLKKQKTELIEANKVVKSTNENLETIVLERTFLLNKTFKELDTVLYKASHDLRAPLSSIAGITDLLNREIDNQELTGLLFKTNNKMDKLLKKLSTISEIHQPGKFERIDVKEIYKNISSSFEKIIKERDIDFTANIKEEGAVLSIPKLVEVIIYHLLENAFFFCWVNNQKKRSVSIDIYSNEENLEIEVTDNGLGIEKVIESKIFEMFYVGNEHSDGNGLGLYIVQKSADLLNGTINVQSEKKERTTFKVILPTNGKGSNTLEFLSSLKA